MPYMVSSTATIRGEPLVSGQNIVSYFKFTKF